MASPKVSIIVPVYNTEIYLKQCIDTLTAQTLEEIEIIIVDDGSKEECANLCDELSKSDSRIKVLHKSNEGQGIARNFGVKAATGEYIAFVDSDDYVDTAMYETLYSVAEKNDADIVSCNYMLAYDFPTKIKNAKCDSLLDIMNLLDQ